MTRLSFASALLLCACGGDNDKKDLSVDAAVADATVVIGADLVVAGDAAAAPIVATANTWTWIPVDDTACSDGSPTGIGVNPGTDPDNLFVFFMGGGACGDYTSCFTAMSAQNGPLGAGEFAGIISQYSDGTGSYLDRTLTDNPFATWTFVFVPYCTGDLHGGIETPTYTSGSTSQMYHHVGHLNALRDLDRAVATWPTLKKLVVAGSSAGGYGALINYPDARNRWPGAESYLIDDSGPPLEGVYTSPLLADWFIAWGLFDWVKGYCPECSNDLSDIITYTAKKYPKDRMALLESLQDQVIRTFYLLQGPDFQTALLQLAMDRLAPLANFKYFFISGDTHTMLGQPAMFSSGTTTLQSYIDAMVSDSNAWTSTTP